MKAKITLKKIAKEFDVSISTVSKALNDSHEISLELKEKIKAFAKYYNYRPNSLALKLRNQETKTIGIIIPQIVHYFFTTVISGVEHIANKNGYNVMICLSHESYEKELLIMDMLANGVVDGIIVSVAKQTDEIGDYNHFKELIENRIPLVLFDRKIDDINCNKVLIDDFGGGYLAVKHLIDVGCRNIAILTTPDHVTVGVDRLDGYIKALEDNDLQLVESLIIKIKEDKDLHHQISTLFDREDPPDGIFAVNEIYAATTLKIAKEKGFTVPDNLAIIGFTDGLISEFSSPPLTSVAQHGFEMGEKSMEILLDEINNQDPNYKFKTKIIETNIVKRESTRKTNK